jgi:RsiW-degrading membrane proteinase PrsW (M82 family)
LGGASIHACVSNHSARAIAIARGEYSWRSIVSAVLFLALALWFLYWDDEVTDYYILLAEREG